jgi:hypothetical protein
MHEKSDSKIYWARNCGKVIRVMFARKASILLATAVLLLQFSDCMASVAAEQQAMQCCATMQCSMEHMSAGCCKITVSAQSPSSLPASKLIVKAPVLAILFHAVVLDHVGPRRMPPTLVKPSQHSPPDLYTLHHSFLI